MTLLWCCCGNALVLRLCCGGIDVDSCGIDVEFPVALLGDCCDIAVKVLGDYCDIMVLLWDCFGIAVILLWDSCDCCGIAAGCLM